MIPQILPQILLYFPSSKNKFLNFTHLELETHCSHKAQLVSNCITKAVTTELHGNTSEIKVKPEHKIIQNYQVLWT